MRKPLSIIIADNDTIYSLGLKSLLKTHNKKDLIRLCKNGKEVLGVLDNEKVDIIFMDYLMPVMDGIETTRKIRELHKEIKVIFISVCTDWIIVNSILEAGIDGYIYKDGKKIEPIIAIDNILAGVRFFSDPILQVILKHRAFETSQSNNDEGELTSHEREALIDIVDGMSVKEAAAKHCRSEATIHTHRYNLYKKAGNKTVIGLMRYAQAKGIISLSSL